ncbi:MAG: hypothetical protein R3223_04785 [Longimicrobiales bacterium]|nr:hypothetical protein [Longimicrobiales bacterium]
MDARTPRTPRSPFLSRARSRPWLHWTLGLALCVGTGVAACGGESPTTPLDDGVPGDGTGTPNRPPIEDLPVTDVTEDDLEPSGTVTETEDGYRVEGELTMSTSDTSSVSLVNADLDVRFDDQGRLRSISGKAEIASPHERIEIEDPVRADVGLFPGKWLNENRDLPILLQDDTDYFVFDFEARLQMNVATGETGEDATRPISVQAPVGGRALMVVDYLDPMYFVYGQQDLLGMAGTGWSLNQRIPFRPTHAVPEVEGGGSFDGGTIRVGAFPIFKIIKVSGTQVDNNYTELHLSTEDPLGSSDLRAGYRQGHDGSMEIDLGIKDMVGIALPLASASGGVWMEASTEDVVRGYTYASGETSNDDSWWPSFIPVKPSASLGTHSYVTSAGEFQIELEGGFGWEFPGEKEHMSGLFRLNNDAMLLEGTVESEDISYTLGGQVTSASTRAYFQPPQELMDELATAVNDEVLPRIEEAEAAWEDLQAATEDYEFELSLRGLREDIPPMVDEGKRLLTQGIEGAIASQRGEIWYEAFRDQLRAADNVYHQQLDQLKAAAQNATDNATTRAVLERELRETAARKIFSYRFTYQVWGVTVYSTTITRRILSDAQADALIEAADNVYRIQETSDLKIQMEQVYQTVNDRELFEGVRDDIQNGVVAMATIEEMGFVVDHELEVPSFDLYAKIHGRTYDLDSISSLTIAELMTELPNAMIEALMVN